MNVNSILFGIALIILISQKYLFWGYSRWQQIKQWLFFLRLRSADHMKFTKEFVMGIEKHILVQKIFTNGLNLCLPLQAWVEKKINWAKRHWLSRRDKVPGAVISKEGLADCLLRHELVWLSFMAYQLFEII